MKPMLASNYDAGKVKYPVIVQPKIDGVRAVNVGGSLFARSLKPHANLYVSRQFAHPWLEGFDGEMIAGNDPCHPDLCRTTTSAMNTIEGEPVVTWWLFDAFNIHTMNLSYIARYNWLTDAVRQWKAAFPNVGPIDSLRVVPYRVANSFHEVHDAHAEWLDQGYEGTILRAPDGRYKQGRSTVREGGLLRIKDFEDAEAVVTGFIEGKTNANEATINPLGLTERSTHQDNMHPNGMIGTIVADDVVSGKSIEIGPGKLTHDERRYYFQNPDKFIGRLIKYQHFPKGAKDKLRFPTFQAFRSTSDV